MRVSVTIGLVAGVVVGVLFNAPAVEAGEIRIYMYSLPGKGVKLRNDKAIRVTPFKTQLSTKDIPLRIGSGRVDLTPISANVGGVFSDGHAFFEVPKDLYGPEEAFVPISFQFEVDGQIVQTVLGAVVPKKGSVELRVVVPDATPQSTIQDCGSPASCYNYYQPNCRPCHRRCRCR